MIALWILYVAVITSLLAAAAYALEHFAAARGWPRRWVWLAAMLALPAMPLLTRTLPIQLVGMPASSVAERSAALSGQATGPAIAPTALVDHWMHSLTTFLDMAREHAQASVGAAVSVSPWLGALWIVATCLLIAGYAATAIRLSAQRRRWPQAHIDGSDVLVAPDVGPAVIGTIRPAIVLPAWALTIEAPARRLIVAHEREHLCAGDPFALHAATFFTYLLPWNVPMWWMLRRLRLAIEMDCDQRVLRGGCDAIRYADLLLTVGHRRSTGRRVLAPALVEHHSLLGRRILAMCPAPSKYRMLRVLLAGTAAGTLVAAAYTVPRPALAQVTPALPVDQRSSLEFSAHPLNTEAVVLSELVAHAMPSPASAKIPAAPAVPPSWKDIAPASSTVELFSALKTNVMLTGVVEVATDLTISVADRSDIIFMMLKDESPRDTSGRHKKGSIVVSARQVLSPAQHAKMIHVRSGNFSSMLAGPLQLEPANQLSVLTDTIVARMTQLEVAPTTR